MIHVDGVTRKYGDFTAVDQVSFAIGQGEIVGLLGHNGAGKTTIMKMMTGYLEPTAGNITFDGKKIASHRQLIQQEIGYLPENCPVYPEMTVVDYLDYAATLKGVADSERASVITDALIRTELTEKAMQKISTLSRGFRQRAGVAQAILCKPRILILDEPTNGLDPTQIQHMRDLIIDMARHSTVLISTHILQEVQAICDRVIIIKDGKKALDAHLQDLQKSGRLLITINTGAEHAVPLLKANEAVQAVEEIAGPQAGSNSYCYSLTLADGSNYSRTAASLAALVHDRKWELYSLQPEAKSLESVFAEMSAR